jgi:hypothetical protein
VVLATSIQEIRTLNSGLVASNFFLLLRLLRTYGTYGVVLATNAEHEGDENEEDKGNAEQVLVGALSASQLRRGRGPNKLSSGRFVITEVNEVGEPTQPPVSVNA